MILEHETDRIRWLAAALVLGLAGVGCAARSTRALDEARRSYNAASVDPTVVAYAPTPLAEAGSTLSRAELEYRRGDDDEVNHLSYVTQRQVARAREIASEKQARSPGGTVTVTREEIVRTESDDSVALQSLAGLHAQQTSRGLELTLSDDFFELDGAELRPSATRELSALASFLRAHPARAIVIEGHTDSGGGSAYNLDLSRRRAAAVQDYLVSRGVDPSRITARGFGEAYPVASNETASGRQANRRVGLLVLNPNTEVSLSSAPVITR
jgi:OOP family OmpA-OmpF porin